MRLVYLAAFVLGTVLVSPSQARAQCSGNYGSASYYYPQVRYAPSARYAGTVPSANTVRYAGEPRYESLPPQGLSTYRSQTSYRPLQTPGAEAPRTQAQSSATTTVRVGIDDNAFQPATITVPPGTTVRWVNMGQHNHTVTSDQNLWDSGDMPPGTSYAATFHGPGTYAFSCRHHEGMRGTIIVGEGSGRTASDRRVAPPGPRR